MTLQPKSDTALSTPAKAAALVAPLKLPTPQEWAAWLLKKAQAQLDAGDTPRFDAQTLIDAAAGVAKVTVAHPEFAARFAKKGIDPAFLGGVLLTRDALDAANKQAPHDARRWEQLTSAERTQVTDAADCVVALRSAVAEAAGPDREDAKALGRGVPIRRHSAESVRESVHTFITAIPTRHEVLALAGIDEDDLAELSQHRDNLDKIVVGKGGVVHEHKAILQQINLQSLAMQTAFQLYRGRSRTALRKNKAQLETALSLLPRAPDRRKTPAQPKEEPPTPA